MMRQGIQTAYLRVGLNPRPSKGFLEKYVRQFFFQTSGDFYWYDTLRDHKFLIVCADSTGHGVPGAFMSMIGTTLIIR
jgi:serine phosphatase RsbU (regulator of sigma subunit)